MKWFKHDCDASDDSRIRKLKAKFGMVGYGVFFNTLELVGRKMEKNIDEFGYLPKEWDLEALAIEFGESPDNIGEIYDYMIKIGLFEKREDRLYNSKIQKRCDEYRDKLLRMKQFSSVVSRHSHDTVPIQSGVLPTLSVPDIDKNKNKNKNIKTNNIKSNIRTSKFSELSEITESIMQEISDKYTVPLAFVRSKYEDMELWAGEKAGRTKGRNWKLTLMNWVKRDALKLKLEERRQHGKPTIVAINPQ